MAEATRILGLFDDLYNGDPWLDVTLVRTLSEISADKAAKKSKDVNSIWEIVNHLISWRDNVLQRISGTTIQTPADNYIVPIEDTSESAWRETLKRLEVSQHQWESFLKNFEDSNMSGIYPPNGLMHYQHIHGIIQHDAYHLGQIVLIAKHLV